MPVGLIQYVNEYTTQNVPWINCGHRIDGWQSFSWDSKDNDIVFMKAMLALHTIEVNKIL